MGVNSYNKTTITAKWPLELFSAAKYLKRETDSVPDERRGQAITMNAILLELEAMQNALGTLPGWQAGETYLDHQLGNMIYGDGTDGDTTISSTVTLTRDEFYNNLTITGAGTLDAAGYRIFVRGTLEIQSGGLLHRDGVAATTGTGATGLTAAVLGGSGAGGNATAAGTSQSNSLGADGGAGGGGGAAGTTTLPTSLPGLRDLVAATKLAWIGTQFTGGAGGGGGSSTGGGGGSGAGLLMIAAKHIINNGTISASGGDGADGQSGTAGGGGGGGGGYVQIVTSEALEGNVPVVLGGTGGAGIGGGTDGGDGVAGQYIVVIL